MRAVLIAVMLTFATHVGAQCGKLCDYYWWETATTPHVQAELAIELGMIDQTSVKSAK